MVVEEVEQELPEVVEVAVVVEKPDQLQGEEGNMTKLIRQLGTMDCGIATAAMFCKVNYEIADKYDPNPYVERGLYVKEFLEIISKIQGKNFQEYKIKRPHPRPLILSYLPNRCALIIRKLNKKFGHFVFYENGIIYDPEFNKPVKLEKYKRKYWLLIRIIE